MSSKKNSRSKVIIGRMIYFLYPFLHFLYCLLLSAYGMSEKITSHYNTVPYSLSAKRLAIQIHSSRVISRVIWYMPAVITIFVTVYFAIYAFRCKDIYEVKCALKRLTYAHIACLVIGIVSIISVPAYTLYISAVFSYAAFSYSTLIASFMLSHNN